MWGSKRLFFLKWRGRDPPKLHCSDAHATTYALLNMQMVFIVHLWLLAGTGSMVSTTPAATLMQEREVVTDTPSLMMMMVLMMMVTTYPSFSTYLHLLLCSFLSVTTVQTTQMWLSTAFCVSLSHANNNRPKCYGSNKKSTTGFKEELVFGSLCSVPNSVTASSYHTQHASWLFCTQRLNGFI